MSVSELHTELLGLHYAINYLSVWLVLAVCLLLVLVFVEVVRLIIVIKRSVKGRMNHVPAD